MYKKYFLAGVDCHRNWQLCTIVILLLQDHGILSEGIAFLPTERLYGSGRWPGADPVLSHEPLFLSHRIELSLRALLAFYTMGSRKP